jgi:Domain of unknown function (DUF932)
MFALNDAEIREIAPSVFADVAAPATSSRYAYVPSYQILREMRLLGLEPVSVREGKKKQPSGRSFAMHQIRFRRADHMAAVAEAGMGGLIPEVIFRNSHDTTSPASFEAGAERVACLNGLTFPDQSFGGFKVRHTGSPSKRYDELHAGMSMLLGKLDLTLQVARFWKSIELSVEQMRQFAERAVTIRGSALSLPVEQVLMVRRPEDASPDLWNVFNRAQENLTRGGLAGHTRTSRRAHLKPISSLVVDVDFNRKLWTAASLLAGEVKAVSVPTFA